jgi:hypothetical protein
MPLALRLLASVLLVGSATLPFAKLTSTLNTGEVVTVSFDSLLSSASVGHPASWISVAAYLWPVVLLPLAFVARSRALRTAIRFIEPLLLVGTAGVLAIAFGLGRPAVGFWVGALAVPVYGLGIFGAPPPGIPRRAA